MRYLVPLLILVGLLAGITSWEEEVAAFNRTRRQNFLY